MDDINICGRTFREGDAVLVIKKGWFKRRTFIGFLINPSWLDKILGFVGLAHEFKQNDGLFMRVKSIKKIQLLRKACDVEHEHPAA